MTTRIAALEVEIEDAEKKYQNDMNNLDRKVESMKSELEKNLASQYPVPAKPQKPKSVRLMEISQNGAATSVQIANEGIKMEILETVEEIGRCTITDIMENCPAAAELSNQRVSALVRQLVTDGSLVRTEEMRKAYFEIA